MTVSFAAAQPPEPRSAMRRNVNASLAEVGESLYLLPTRVRT
jgi:hypothetical protein